jgi:glutaredoxin-related protein
MTRLWIANVLTLLVVATSLDRSNGFAPAASRRLVRHNNHHRYQRIHATSNTPLGSTNNAGDDIREKLSNFLQDLKDTIQFRYNLFSTARSKDGYNFKQSMAIAIAGEYDQEQVRQQIQNIVESNPFVLFTWESSPSCKQAVAALEKMNKTTPVQFTIFRLDDPWSEGNKLRAELGKMTGKSSVPSIWINGQYVGGYDAGVSEEAPGIVTMAFQGTLRPMLEKAGAFEKKPMSDS